MIVFQAGYRDGGKVGAASGAGAGPSAPANGARPGGGSYRAHTHLRGGGLVSALPHDLERLRAGEEVVRVVHLHVELARSGRVGGRVRIGGGQRRRPEGPRPRAPRRAPRGPVAIAGQKNAPGTCPPSTPPPSGASRPTPSFSSGRSRHSRARRRNSPARVRSPGSTALPPESTRARCPPAPPARRERKPASVRGREVLRPCAAPGDLASRGGARRANTPDPSAVARRVHRANRRVCDSWRTARRTFLWLRAWMWASRISIFRDCVRI